MPATRSPRPADPAPAAEWTDTRIATGARELAVRIYGQRKAGAHAALVVHLHGGEFVCGSLDSGRAVARVLASAGAVVVSVDYPLAPEHPFPEAVEAVHAALMWAWRARSKLAGAGARLFVAGEEAGGNLAAAMGLVARDRQEPPLAGLILLSPMVDACVGTASLRHSDAGPVGCKWADGWCKYLRGPAAAEHPYAVPARATRLAGLPPSLLVTAADDPLRDETCDYARKLRGAGLVADDVVLAAPTGWPTALFDPAGAEAPWAEPMRVRIRAFLAGTQP